MATSVHEFREVCSHGRDKKHALQMLDESMQRLQTDHLSCLAADGFVAFHVNS